MQMGTPKSEFCISDFFDNDATSSNPNMSDFLKKASKFFSGSNREKKQHKKAGEKGGKENEENRKENDGNKEEKEVEAVNPDEENSEKWGKKLKNRGKLFVGGLNPGTTAQNLEIYFSRFGKIVDSVVMRCPKTSKSRGFGFVTFAEPANAEKALQGNHILDGKVIETRPFGKKKAGNRVFLGSIPQTAKEDDLKEFFTRYGEVTSVDIINDKITKNPKGFAFLSFKEPEAMEKCLSESFVHIGGKRVHIRKADQRLGSKINDDASIPDLSQVEESFDEELGEDAASMIDNETHSSSSGGQWSVFDKVPRFKKVFEDYMLSKTGDAEKVNDAETKDWNDSAEKEVADVEKLLMDLFLNSGVNIGEEEENLIVFSTDEETTEEGTSDEDGSSSSSDELDDILDGTSNRYLRATDGEFRKTFLGKGDGDCDSSRKSPNLFLKKGSLWCSLCQWQPLDGSKESFFAHCQTPDHRLKTQERFNLKQNQGSKPEAKSIFTAAAATRSKSLEKLLIGESESEEGEKLKTKQKKNPKEPQMNQQKQPQQQLQQKRLQQDQMQQKEKQQQKQVQPMKQQQEQQLQLQKAKQKQQSQPQEQQKPSQQHQKQQQQKPSQQNQKQQQQKPSQQNQKQQQQQNQPRKNVQQQQKQLQQNKEHQNNKTENKKEEGKTKEDRRNISNLKIHALAKGMVSIRPLKGNMLHCTMCGKTIPQAQSFDILMKNLSQHLQSKKHLRNLSETETSLKNVLGEKTKEGKGSSSIRNNSNIPACTTSRSAGKLKMETGEHSKVQGESSVGGKARRKRKTQRKNNERAETGVGDGKKEKTDKGSGANRENKFLCLHCKFRSGRDPFRDHLKSKSHSDCLRGRGVSSDDFLNSRNVCPGCQSVLFGSLYDINQHYSGCLGV